MSPHKRQRHETGSSSKKNKGKQLAIAAPPPDEDIFCVPNGKANYEQQSKKITICERAFAITSRTFIHINEEIHRRRWTKFCEPTTRANLSLVREFYANNRLPDHQTCVVRGVEIHWDGALFNRHYGIGTVNSDWADLAAAVTEEQIGEVLCDGTPEWIRYHDRAKQELKWKSINVQAKTWLSFIFSNLMPTTSATRVNFTRCALCYHIMIGTPIDIGDIIRDQLWTTMTDKSKAFYFPILITELCKSHKVPLKPTDIEIPPKGPIDDRAIRQFKVTDVVNTGHTERQEEGEHDERARPSVDGYERRLRHVERGIVMVRNELTNVKHKMSTMEALQRWSGKMMQKIGTALRCDFTDCAEPIPLPPPIFEPLPAFSDDENEAGDSEPQGGDASTGAAPDTHDHD